MHCSWIHHNHDVLNIKKIYPLIYGKTQGLHKFLSEKLTLNKILDTIYSHLMRKDELTLINYYYDYKNNISSQIETNGKKSLFNIKY